MKDVSLTKENMIKHKVSNETYMTLYMLFVLFVIIVVASLFVPTFLSIGTFLNILAQQSYLIIMGIGVTFLLLTGNFDLSVGSVASCAAVLSVFFCQPLEGSASSLGMNNGWGLSVPAAMILALLVCLGIGAINALFIVRYKIASVIVTLGTLYISRGIAQVVAQGANRNLGLPDSFSRLGDTTVGPLGLPVVIMLVGVAIALIVEKGTVFGRRMYHIGANRDAAVISGIKVNKQLTSLYLISALLSGFTGLIIASKFKSGSSYAANGYEFDALAAAILGGTSILGGFGSIVSLLIGVFILGIISTCLNQMGFQPATQTIFKGIILVIAVIAQRVGISRRSRKL
jgi:ribose transport system permease protein